MTPTTPPSPTRSGSEHARRQGEHGAATELGTVSLRSGGVQRRRLGAATSARAVGDTVVRPALARRARLFWNDILRLFSESRTRARLRGWDGVASPARSSSILRRPDTGGTHDDSRANRRASTTDSITLLFAASTSTSAAAPRYYRRVITVAANAGETRTIGTATRSRLPSRVVL